MMSRTTDMIWMIARYQSVQLWKSQKVPSWTGFYFEVTTPNDYPPHSISFLPTINQPPTQFDTVHEVLPQAKRKSEVLGLASADLVFGHAIYAKALRDFEQSCKR